MKTILITGGTGMIGSAVSKLLQAQGYAVRYLSRRSGSKNGIEIFQWGPSSGEMDEAALDGVHGVIHLSGAPIAPKRWTKKRVQVLKESRGGAAKLLYDACTKTGCRPEFFISASGVNYHGAVTSNRVLTESVAPGNDTIAEITIDWESKADLFNSISRVVKLRTPIVLSRFGGALPKLTAPIKFGFGAAFGSGKQWMPWVHLDDIAQAYLDSVIDLGRSGVYHVTAPEHISNSGFTRACAEALSKPLWLPNIPAFILHLGLGRQAKLLVNGTRASGERLRQAGHVWKYPKLQEALRVELDQ